MKCYLVLSWNQASTNERQCKCFGGLKFLLTDLKPIYFITLVVWARVLHFINVSSRKKYVS